MLWTGGTAHQRQMGAERLSRNKLSVGWGEIVSNFGLSSVGSGELPKAFQ